MDSIVLLERRPFFSRWNIGSAALFGIGSFLWWLHELHWIDSDIGILVALLGATGLFLFGLLKLFGWFDVVARVEISTDSRTLFITRRGLVLSSPIRDVGVSDWHMATLLLIPVAHSFAFILHRGSAVARSSDTPNAESEPVHWRKETRMFLAQSWFMQGGRRAMHGAVTAVIAAQQATRNAHTPALAPV